MINIEEVRAILIGVKACIRCGETKPLDDFPKKKYEKREGVCKKCRNKAHRERPIKRKEGQTEKVCSKCFEVKQLEDFVKGKDGINGRSSTCKKCTNERNKYLRTFKPKISKPKTEAQKAKNLIYEKANPERRKARSKRYKDKTRMNPMVKLNDSISTLIRISLHGNKRGLHWENLVGYSLDDLKKHLEKKFKKGMQWENYGLYGWHIDHKIPLTAFHFEKPEDIDFRRAWSLSNLQPMWAVANIVKSNKLSKPFQPALKITVIRKAA